MTVIFLRPFSEFSEKLFYKTTPLEIYFWWNIYEQQFLLIKTFKEVQIYSSQGSTKNDLGDFKIKFQLKDVVLLEKASQ